MKIPMDLRRLLRPRQDLPIVVDQLSGGQYKLDGGEGEVIDEEELEKRVEELNIPESLPSVVAIDFRDE
jgi:hypothetical protein